MINKTTNKKFYGKWLYKTTLRLKGISLLRSAPTLNDYFKLKNANKKWFSRSLKDVESNENEFIDFCNFTESLDKSTFFKRIESNSVDFYTNDQTMYDSFNSKFKELIVHTFSPDKNSNLESLSSNSIVGKKLPHDRYRYRVYLSPHKFKGDKDRKYKFILWLDTQGSKIKISDTVKKWFISTDWNWDRRYMLVEDEQTLLLLKMRSSEAIGKVYEYQIVDK